jgi:hypothetical protein
MAWLRPVMYLVPEVGKVTSKSNNDEAVSEEFL